MLHAGDSRAEGLHWAQSFVKVSSSTYAACNISSRWVTMAGLSPPAESAARLLGMELSCCGQRARSTITVLESRKRTIGDHQTVRSLSCYSLTQLDFWMLIHLLASLHLHYWMLLECGLTSEA
jgi:hypothetical protein